MTFVCYLLWLPCVTVTADAPFGGWCPPAVPSDSCSSANASEEFTASLLNWDAFKALIWPTSISAFFLPLADTLRQMECTSIYWKHCDSSAAMKELCSLYEQILLAAPRVLQLDLSLLFSRCGGKHQDALGTLLAACETSTWSSVIWWSLRNLVHCLASSVKTGEEQETMLGMAMHYWHSPSQVCFRDDLIWWHEEPPELLEIIPDDAWVINLGASNGGCRRLLQSPGPPTRSNLFETQDPANCLLNRSHRASGIFFEGNKKDYMELEKALGNRSDLKLAEKTDPGHFKTLVRNYVAQQDARGVAGLERRAKDPLLLKVDVDNCDCCFLEVLLNDPPEGLRLRPAVIHVEVHPLVPPPIAYRPLRYSFGVGDSLLEIGPEHGRRGHFLHCSLTAFMELLLPLGYHLAHLLFNDAIFIREPMPSTSGKSLMERLKSANLAERLWYGSFFCHPLRPSPIEVHYMIEFQYDYRVWNDVSIPPKDRIELIRSYLDAWRVPRAFYTLYESIA